MQHPSSYVKVSSMDIVENNAIYVETINVNEISPIEGIVYSLHPNIIYFCYELMKLQESYFVKAFVFGMMFITTIKKKFQNCNKN